MADTQWNNNSIQEPFPKKAKLVLLIDTSIK